MKNIKRPGLFGPSFDPRRISGLQLWLRADVGTFQDAAKTTLADADTDPVGAWADQSGNGNDALQTTDAERPTYSTANAIAGNPVIWFDGVTDLSLLTTAFLNTTFGRDFTFFVVTNKVGNIGIRFTSTAMPIGVCWTSYRGGTDTVFYTQDLTDTTLAVAGGSSVPMIEAFRFDGTMKTGLTNRAAAAVYEYENANKAMGFANATLKIGRHSTVATYFWDGGIAEMLVYNRALTNTKFMQVYNYLVAKYGLTSPITTLGVARKRLVFDGDSISVSPSATDCYPLDCLSNLGGSTLYSYYNLGVSGQTIVQMAADAVTDVDARFDDSAPMSVCVCFGGTNDLYASVAPATVYANIVSYCQARRAAGYKVVIVTVLPRSAIGTPGGFEADRQTLNTSIRAGYTTFADALADVAANTDIGDFGDSDDLTYYLADKVHPNSVGAAVIGGIVSTAIGTL